MEPFEIQCTDLDLRDRSLSYAIGYHNVHGGNSPSQVIDTAQMFYDFLKINMKDLPDGNS